MRRTRMGADRITVDELGDNDAILVEISGASIKSFSGNYLEGGDEKVVLTFKEFGDAEYVLNATSFRALADRYGNDKRNGFQSWVDQPCVLVRAETEDPRTNDKIQSVWVARPQQWTEAIRALKADEPASAKKAAKKTAKKSTAK